MSTTIKIGSTVKGKITGIQPYGAFVLVDGKTNGLVHISEITHGFVKNINDHVQIDEEITAKVLGVDDQSGNLRLSMKDTANDKNFSRKNNDDNYIKQLERADGFNILKIKLAEWIEQVKGNIS